MKKLTLITTVLIFFALGIGIGNWLAQAKQSTFAGDIFTKGKTNDPSSTSTPLAGIISVNNTISSSAYDLQKAFNTVANVATRAVVSIQVTVPVQSGRIPEFFGNDEFFKRFFNIPKQQEPRKSEAFGSGFLIDPEGYLLSNNHVVENAETIKILFKDNDKTYTATVVGNDPDTDIALLKINEPGPFPYLVLGDSDKVQIGDIAIAIGNPFGLSHTFTTGVVSAKGRSGIVGNRYENFIQTDVAINRGNSGGPLLNLNGEVIGINSAILSKTGGSIGIGFSIPINMAKNVAEQLRRDGKVNRGWVGIYFEEVNSDVAEALNVPKRSVLVSQVVENSPAEKAGIIAGDVIYSFDDKAIKNGNDFLNKISVKSKGEKIHLGIIRNGKKIRLNVVLGEEQGTKVAQNQQNSQPKKNNLLGIIVRDLSPSEQTKLGRNYGIMITSLHPQSPLLSTGVKTEDILLTLNKQKIKNISDFNKKLKKIEKSDKVLIQLQRGRSVRYIIVRL